MSTPEQQIAAFQAIIAHQAGQLLDKDREIQRMTAVAQHWQGVAQELERKLQEAQAPYPEAAPPEPAPQPQSAPVAEAA